MRAISGPFGYAKDHIQGLEIAVASASTITIAAGECRSDDDTLNLDNTGTITIDITASGENGLDTGAESASTWYDVYVIAKAGGAVAGVVVADGNAITYPSGYAFKRYLGSFYNNDSSDLMKMTAITTGRRVKFQHIELDGTALAPAGTRVISQAWSTSYQDMDPSAMVPSHANVVSYRLGIRMTSGSTGTFSAGFLLPAGSTEGNDPPIYWEQVDSDRFTHFIDEFPTGTARFRVTAGTPTYQFHVDGYTIQR